MRITTIAGSGALAALLLAASPVASPAQSNIDPANAFAWGENIGWINLLPSSEDGVVVTPNYLSGFAWAENVGWINFGTGPDNSTAYTQTATDFGVNNDGSGNLTGYAWGENIGWINFDTSSVAGPTGQVTIDMASGEFAGFAWGENIGWINFAHDYGVAFLPEATSVEEWFLFQ